ncbi:hypothetical protein GOP47_0015388 [Adiantum capillus-veneris]|uniref:Uncharacterized protein n=1 Tax=Adiantum capillus-veneris TaxID=13818 RepID=A0A9D4UKB8_ADICA|nr:hypothetical protein GOP47_0015388 [Adiantum capillus-veneris]
MSLQDRLLMLMEWLFEIRNLDCLLAPIAWAPASDSNISTAPSQVRTLKLGGSVNVRLVAAILCKGGGGSIALLVWLFSSAYSFGHRQGYLYARVSFWAAKVTTTLYRLRVLQDNLIMQNIFVA